MKLLKLALLCAMLFVGSAQAAIIESVRLQFYFGLDFHQGQEDVIHDGETNVQIGNLQWDYVKGALTYRFTNDALFSGLSGYGFHDASIPVRCTFEDGQPPCNWILFVPFHGEFFAGDTKTFVIGTIPEPSVVLLSVFGIALVLIRRWPRSKDG